MPSLTAPDVLAASASIRSDELARFEHHGSDVLVGEMVADLGATRSMLGNTTPREWERIASVLLALLDRHPFRDGPRYSGERIILGAFATELRAYARLAGEPTADADLRAPDVIAGEREAEARVMGHAV